MRCKFLLLILVLSTCAIAQDQGVWEDATEAYRKGIYQDAIAAYELLLDRGVRSGELHYNLGNAYYQTGDVAKAILHYERALRFLPGDPEITNNLTIANSQRQDAVIPVSRFFLYRWIRNMASLMGPCGWSILSLLLLWGAIAMLCYSIWYSAGKVVRRLTFVCAICTGAAITFGAVRLHDLRSDAYAIVMPQHVKVLVAPDPESKVTVEISAGEKVRILDSLDNFYKVRLPNYEDGWVAEDFVERI